MRLVLARSTSDRQAKYLRLQPEKSKEKTSFNISNTVSFRMKAVDGSSVTICASSVHEYPSFFVRSISARTIVSIASVESIVTSPKVGYQFTITQRTVIKMLISFTEW